MVILSRQHDWRDVSGYCMYVYKYLKSNAVRSETYSETNFSLFYMIVLYYVSDKLLFDNIFFVISLDHPANKT